MSADGLAAVTFDLGDTLVTERYRRETVEAAWAAGVAALQRPDAPPWQDLLTRFRAVYVPRLARWTEPTEILYLDVIRELFGALSFHATKAEAERFVASQLEVRRGAKRVHPDAVPVLRELRERGFKLGLVSNASEPAHLMHREFEALGLGGTFDAVVFTSSVGLRKPHPAPFLAALDQLDVVPSRVVHVGDDPSTDVAGAEAIGARAVLATWYTPERPGSGASRARIATSPRQVIEIASAESP